MINITNNTVFSSLAKLMPNEHGEDTVYIIVKAGYAVNNDILTLLKQQPAIQVVDQYRDKPNNSSLQYPGDTHLLKPATDIIVNGVACAKNYMPVSQLMVSIVVGELENNLAVYGNRYWQQGLPSIPEIFTSIPMIDENAYGGRDNNLSYPYNPLGKGYITASDGLTEQAVEGFPLPNIERPNALIKTIHDQPIPAGIGAVAPYSPYRLQYVGTYDEQWQRKRAPYFPLDYDTRFQNAAQPDFIYPGFLQGGERVQIDNMHPSGQLAFALPIVQLNAVIDFFEETPQSIYFTLDTLYLEPSDLRATLVWQGVYTIQDHRSIITGIALNQTVDDNKHNIINQSDSVSV